MGLRKRLLVSALVLGVSGAAVISLKGMSAPLVNRPSARGTLATDASSGGEHRQRAAAAMRVIREAAVAEPNRVVEAQVTFRDLMPFKTSLDAVSGQFEVLGWAHGFVGDTVARGRVPAARHRVT